MTTPGAPHNFGTMFCRDLGDIVGFTCNIRKHRIRHTRLEASGQPRRVDSRTHSKFCEPWLLED